MKPDDLIQIARDLVDAAGPGRPRQTYLCRAVSSSYYAMFHTLCRTVADIKIGKTRPSQGSPAWIMVYRKLSHRKAKSVCEEEINSPLFPPSITDFAETFLEAQTNRHRADYDPSARYFRSNVLRHVNDVEDAIKAFRGAPATAKKEFVAKLVFKERK